MHEANYYAYGYRRMWKALLRAGEQVGRGRVQRLMRQARDPGRQAAREAVADHDSPTRTRQRRPDLVQRDFTAARARPAVGRGLHLSALLGGRGLLRVRDRRLQPPDRRLAVRVAHAHRPRPRRAADGAGDQRAPAPTSGSSHHTDAGSQYTSADYTQMLDDHGVLASIGSVGDAYDNAMAESFVDSFKTELIADRVWRTRSQLELAVVEYVGWFNNDRLHESLGDIPPVEFEQNHAAAVAVDPEPPLLKQPARLPDTGTTPLGSSPLYGVQTRLADNN